MAGIRRFLNPSGGRSPGSGRPAPADPAVAKIGDHPVHSGFLA
jgi:hypothetical protein